MKSVLLLVFITLFFSGCDKKILVKPTLHPVYVEINKLSDCNVTYEVKEDGNVTLSLEDGKCIANKLSMCLKDRKKLTIANNSNIAQMLLLNTLK